LFLGHNFRTQNLSKSSKVSKDSDFSLVYNKNLSEILPSNGLVLGTDEMGQKGLKLFHLRRHSQKIQHPKPKKVFFHSRLDDLPSLLKLEQLSNAIPWGVALLLRHLVYAWFQLKSPGSQGVNI